MKYEQEDQMATEEDQLALQDALAAREEADLKKKRNEARKHSRIVGAGCRKSAAKKYGLGWPLLSEVQQQNAIAMEVVSVMFSVASSGTDSKYVLDHLKIVGQAALYPGEELCES